MAGVDLWGLQVLPRRSRESVRAGTVHRLGSTRGLCGAGQRPCRLRLPTPSRTRPDRRGSVALRRRHRPAISPSQRNPTGPAIGSLRIRGLGDMHDPDRSPLGVRGVRLHEVGGRARTSHRSWAPFGPAATTSNPHDHSTRPSRLHRRATLSSTHSAALDRGGIVAINAIHLDRMPEFDYGDLWWERQIRSVANVTRSDVRELIDLAAAIPIRTTVQRYSLEQANSALDDLQSGRVHGAAVVVPGAG